MRHSVRLLVAVAFLLAWSARADVLNGFELFPLFDTAAPWEASTPVAAEVKDQKRFPYCGLFAMATFLEVWGDASHTGHVFPPIDESYLSLGYNRVVGSPKMGTSPTWLALTTQIFGVLPKGAKFRGTNTWPILNWRKENTRLIPTTTTDPLLTGKYVWGRNPAEFTGPQFLKDYIRIDLRNFLALHTNFEETFKKTGSPNEEEAVAAEFRVGDIEATAKNMQALAVKMGTDTRMGIVTPEVLYQAAKLQLYARRPVYLAINAGLTADRFRKYGVITNQDLVPVGQGFNGAHAVVAVAHCDKTNSLDRICQRFGPYMSQRKVDECIAVQNSWGPSSNERGYFCLAPDAWKRVAQALLIEKNLVKGN